MIMQMYIIIHDFHFSLGVFVVKALNEGFTKKLMSATQREGLIILLPKGDKSRKLIKKLAADHTAKCGI